MSTIGTPVTLWCIARGSTTAFKVTAGTDNDLSDLREMIKEKRKPRFDDFAPDDLILWRVNVDQNVINTINDMLNDDNKLLISGNTVGVTFHDLGGTNIRVVVGVPIIEQPGAKRPRLGDPSFEDILEIVASLKRNQHEIGIPSTSTGAQEPNLQDIISSPNSNELFAVEESALYIRQAYKDLYQKVIDPDQDHRFLITGTSGVGKSSFLIYLLIRLLCSFDDVTVIFRPSDGDLAYCFENSNLIVRQIDEITNVLYLPKTWYLVDSVAPSLVKAKTVLAVSPNNFKDKDFDEFAKRVVNKYCMPPWTIEELLTCREHVFPQVPENLMLDLVDRAGGVPRYVLRTPARLIKKHKNPTDQQDYDIIVNKSMERIEEAISEIENFNKLMLCFAENADFVKISSRIIHRWPDPSYEDHYFEWASSYIYHTVMRNLEKFRWDDLLQKIQNPCDPTNARGIMFESYVIHHFMTFKEKGEGFRYNMRCLEENDNRILGISLRVQEKNIKYARTAQDLSNYNADNLVIRPTVKNFGAADLFVMPNYVFQITVSKKHPIKQKELAKIIPNMLAYRRDSSAIIRLVFVVPDDIYADFEYQRYVTSGHGNVERLSPVLSNVEQWVLKIDVSMQQ